MYLRPFAAQLSERLAELPMRIQILAGPRQVGKTTLVRQILSSTHRPLQSSLYLAADNPGPNPMAFDVGDEAVALGPTQRLDAAWLLVQWRRAQHAAAAWRDTQIRQGRAVLLPFVFVIDEIQKVLNWSEAVKGLWDEQIAGEAPMHLVLLGSSPLLMQHGLSESLAGRYEVLRMGHWSYTEMQEAFGFTLDQYIYFGGFPGSAPLIQEEARWRDYVLHALIGPNIEKDILMMTRVDKPVLLKQLFELGCLYSGQILSLDKALGQLKDAGNVTTLARYLDLLKEAGLLAGLHKYADQALRKRQSPPKFQVLNTALMSAQGSHGFEEARADRSHWGRLVESAVGAHLCNGASSDTGIHYWREASLEVDFVASHRGRLVALEVKSGKLGLAYRGLDEFARRNPGCTRLVVGGDDLPLGEFLSQPPLHWLG